MKLGPKFKRALEGFGSSYIIRNNYPYFFGKVIKHIPLETLTEPFAGFTSSAV